MSLRNRLVVPVVFSALALLAGCGSSNSQSGSPPPTGGFSNSNLNGTYVFALSGTDSNGNPYAMAGTFTANGTGGVTGGAVDINGPSLSAPAPNGGISSNSTYTVGADGRGQATLNTNTPFGKVILDFVLQDNSHGLVTEFDGIASGSGTLDVQTSGTTPNGSYAFSLFGANLTSFANFAAVGDFTVGSGGAISGLEDFNAGGVPYAGTSGQGNTLSGSLVLGPSSSGPSTTLTTSAFSTLTFDAIAIDATHLKFIEMDTAGTLSGDAYSQTSTSMPAGTLPFTLAGALSGGAPFAAGGFMVTDSSGDITSASSEDFNASGTSISSAPVTFSGSYVANGTGRFLLNNFSGFEGASQFVAYPSSAGTFLLEVDSTLGIMSGIAYPAQSSTTFASAQGYGLNLSGLNLSNDVEVDDIAEFTAASSGTITGYLDENCSSCGGGSANISLGSTSTFSAPTGGRGQIGTGANSINTLNGGFLLTYYTVDGTTVPFIETDNGQVASGVMFVQNASASAAAMAKATGKHLYVPPKMMKARKAHAKQK